MLKNWVTYLSVSPGVIWRLLNLNHWGSSYRADCLLNQGV